MSCVVAGWGFCIHRWTTELLEVLPRDKPAWRETLPPTPESWRSGRERGGGEDKGFALFLCIHSIKTHPLKLIRWRTVKRRVYLHREPCVSNLRLNLNHLIWASAVGTQLREPSSRSELEAKERRVQDAELYANYMQRNRQPNLITAWSGFLVGKVYGLLWV